jgi:cell division protein ZapA (FtsZ GTPase activity inhibitor)
VKGSTPVTVYGQSLILRSDSSEDEVRRVADFVNQAIDSVNATDRVADSLHIVLLAFLNVAQAYLQLQSVRHGEEQELLARMNRLAQRLEDELEHAPDTKLDMSLCKGIF